MSRVMGKLLSRVGFGLLSAMVLAMPGCGSGGDPSDFLITAQETGISVMADYTTPAITLNVRGLNAFGTTSRYLGAVEDKVCSLDCKGKAPYIDVAANAWGTRSEVVWRSCVRRSAT